MSGRVGETAFFIACNYPPGEPSLTAKDLTKYAYGVAKGMEFIVSKGVSREREKKRHPTNNIGVARGHTHSRWRHQW